MYGCSRWLWARQLPAPLNTRAADLPFCERKANSNIDSLRLGASRVQRPSSAAVLYFSVVIIFFLVEGFIVCLSTQKSNINLIKDSVLHVRRRRAAGGDRQLDCV